MVRSEGKGLGANRWKDRASRVVFRCLPAPPHSHQPSHWWCSYDDLIWHLNKGQQREGTWDQRHTSLLKGHRASRLGHSCGHPNSLLNSHKFYLQFLGRVPLGPEVTINILGVAKGWLIRGDTSLSAQWKQSSLSTCKQLSCWLYCIFYFFSESSACLTD